MVRISGVTLPNKRLEVALTYVYGIGKTTAQKILIDVGVDFNTRPKDLKEDEIKKIRNQISAMVVEGDLRRISMLNIRRLKEIKSYRGLRHGRRLPSRGQKTRTNSRTRRGNKRMTMGSGRRQSAQKT